MYIDGFEGMILGMFSIFPMRRAVNPSRIALVYPPNTEIFPEEKAKFGFCLLF